MLIITRKKVAVATASTVPNMVSAQVGKTNKQVRKRVVATKKASRKTTRKRKSQGARTKESLLPVVTESDASYKEASVVDDIQSLEQGSKAGVLKEVGRQLAEMREVLLEVRQAVHISVNQARNCLAMPTSARSAFQKTVNNSSVGVDMDTCRYCKELGHWMRNCPHLKQKDAGWSRPVSGEQLQEFGRPPCSWKLSGFDNF